MLLAQVEGDSMYELMAIEMSLKPRKFNQIPRWQGRAAQALFYATLHRIHPMVSETIHDLYKWHPRMPKPFTMSSIVGAVEVDDLIQLKPTETIELRLTTLHPHITSIVQHGVLPIWLREGFSLHDQYLKVLKITQHTRLHYSDLLHQASDSPQILLDFTSPTSFKKTEGYYYAKPNVELIFMSLFNRWNAFATEKLPDALCETITKRICIVDYAITQDVLSFARGKKGTIPGFSGTVRIILNEPSASLRKMINALAGFAKYSGVGVKTTVGMGQVQAI
jgi:CRISPR-associated endoribonuclease Cas6